jgi:hypothetical protein
MSFDEQPDGDPHWECAAEIHRLEEHAEALTVLLAAKTTENEVLKAQIAALKYPRKCTCIEPQKWTEPLCPTHDFSAWIDSIASSNE